ncbi:undecaprenyl-phosphate glucose phosphotransferase [Hydrogenovibrio sp. 3SP14C1]|uniref:undecaprenyl-phosphate glucose phosphotransferase n=1 Tax=Hydrogenovibrio sp. 3SP14C1 TaxID=3038774 RepID=UPI002417358D|nr:undecaprenyl-phosphate glucose phosphotransferase [Hydrogenovibrio sp. 3SP14C1]MDG4812235.1 undecaprenyl-phosphate glucose phosphotransferase [Hydrogenovibrio sp. 3SP14C1]
MIESIKPDQSGFVWIHRVTDLILPFLILSLSLLLYEVPWHDRYIVLGMLGGLIFVTAAQMVGIYQNWRGRPIFNSIQLIIKAWIITWAFLIILAFLLKDSENFSRGVLLIWATLTLVSLIGYRFLIRIALIYFRTKGFNNRKIAIVGAGKVGQHLAQVVNSNPWLGYQIIGFYDDNPNLTNQKIDNLPILGTSSEIFKASQQGRFDELYICLPLRAESRIKQLLNQLTDSAIIVKFIPDLFTFDLMHAKWTDLKGIPIVSVFDTPLSSTTARILKRSEDVILSFIILILISPVLLSIAITIKLTSTGPIIFKQKRYGLNGEEIKVYKFRSMTTQDNGPVVNQATKNDIRITPLGGFLRRTSLDELPQFINVLQGKMSIVGPRPHAIAHNEEYRQLIPKYMQRHLVKPGITGWAQINGWRGETDTLEKMEKRVEYDLHYINNWSLWLDTKIIVLTVFKGFINKNAY